jgi:hypothetical protein
VKSVGLLWTICKPVKVMLRAAPVLITRRGCDAAREDRARVWGRVGGAPRMEARLAFVLRYGAAASADGAVRLTLFPDLD